MRCCSIFSCDKGTCLEKNADYANGSADHEGHGMVQSQPGLQNVEQFSFPVLISRIENLKVEKHDNAEITLQGDWQNSVEMFGSKKKKKKIQADMGCNSKHWESEHHTSFFWEQFLV